MSEVIKRDQQIAALIKLCDEISDKYATASLGRIIVWKKRVLAIWIQLNDLHEDVITKTDEQDMPEQETLFNDVTVYYDRACVQLEEQRISFLHSEDKPQFIVPQLEDLQRQYIVLSKRLQIVCQHVANKAMTIQACQAKLHLKAIDDVYQEMRKMVMELVKCGANHEDVLRDEEQYDRLYLNTIEILALAKNVQPASDHATTTNQQVVDSGLYLPRFNIAPFDGPFEKWEAFRESFTQAIHLRKNMPAVQKLQYLKSVLRGEPEELIRNFTLTEDNYEPAWELLNSRYNNQRELVHSHLDVLTSFPVCKSADDLRRMCNKTTSSLMALKNLKRPVHTWDDWVVYHICKKVDIETRRMWEQHQVNNAETTTWDELDRFLQGRIRALATSGASQQATPKMSAIQHNKVRAHQTETANKRSWQTPIVTESEVQKFSCKYCDQSHLITFCEKFRALSPHERRGVVAEKSLCFVCLRSGHQANRCNSDRTCQTCNQRHSTMLHLPSENQNTGPRSNVSVNLAGTRSQVLLATAVVNVQDDHGQLHKLRALLDQGSEASFVSEEAAQILRLHRENERVDIVGLNGITAGTSRHSIVMRMSDCHGMGFAMDVRALVIPRVSSRPENVCVTANHHWSYLSDIQLADPEFMRTKRIDILLGSDVYGTLLLPGLRKHQFLPTAQNTALGWILSGNVPYHGELDKKTSNVLANHTAIDDQLARFWELEEPTTLRRHTVDEDKCEAFYEKTVSRDDSGRIHVRLPMKENATFGESQRFAVQRQLQIERRFQTQPEYATRYRAFMAEYEGLGHMKEVVGAPVDLTCSREMIASSHREYYIPHHAVMKESSTSTKLRVVFDASRRTMNGVSLNEQMHIGPRVQDDITSIMMRWRAFKVGFCADIEKMYRQIVVDEPDADLQRIVWRSSTDKPMKVYQLRTVTYGTSSAPYLSTKTLNTLARMENDRYPIGANLVQNHFYVDDVLGGAESDGECVAAKVQVDELLRSGGLVLRKWASNSEMVLSTIPAEHRECEFPLRLDGESISALGLQWNPARDEINFKINIPTDTKQVTKRSFLSAASRLYDPLGWLAPSIIEVKILFQSLWKLKLEWDDPLPDELAQRWIQLRSGLQVLGDIKIKRWIGTTSENRYELHGFCDASMDAYAAVVYVRVLTPEQPVRVYNICAKTKVAPIKVISLPRLELCGAVLLAKIMSDVITAMKWANVRVKCWTDSTIVLAWLNADPSRFNVFVANRIAEVQGQYPIKHWQHVSTDDNPADCASRGISPAALVRHPLWWSGPAWLREHDDYWPQNEHRPEQTCEEMRANANTTTVIVPEWDLFKRYSNWRKLVRVTAWCLRFTQNCRKPITQRKFQAMDTDELQYAKDILVRVAQSSAFPDEIRCLRNNRPICKSSSLRALNPIFSSANLLVVGGRLSNAQEMTESARLPAIIPRRSHISALLISDAHEKTLHGGQSLVLAYLRRTYWVIDGPNEVRRFIKKCTVCFRFTCKPNHQQMAPLPSARVVPSRPFSHCALDYSGAIMVRSSKGRGHHASKAYVAVFVCLATKAVHIELVSDLTTAGFIAAYERFTARRGLCSDLYSDNATNFVGASKVFLRTERALFDKTIQATLAIKGTNWHFSPPLSPHFNGLAESAIRSVKHHIRRVIGETTLTFEELTTVLTKIEACLNSRPLCAMTSDPNDFDVLTPGHFLVGEPILNVPQKNALDTNLSTLTRWQLTHQLVQRFWNRWSVEYLHTLQQRRKWQTPCDNVKVGDLVLVIEDNMPPSKWVLGRISEVHPGDDGRVRVVSIRTMKATYKRSVVKIARLPIDCELTTVASRGAE